MKLFFGLVCAVLLTAFSTTIDAQAQPYTVCNNSPVAVNVCLWIDCGGVPSMLPPCTLLVPGQCFTWPVPAGCFPIGLDINGTYYAVQPAGTVVPLPPPNPPNQLVFTGAVPDVIIQ